MNNNSSAIVSIARLAAGRWLITTLLLLAAGSLVAQTDKQVWVQRFGSTFGSSELARSIARVWTNRYYGPLGHADEGRAIAVTGVGQVVVLCASSGDFATVKY